MISIINYTVRFLFTAPFVIINSFLKRCHHLIHHSFSKKLLIKETKLVLYWIILGVTPLGLALLYIQVLPSDIRKYFGSFLITAAAAVFISMIISVIENCIFMDVNSYVGNKVELTWLWPNLNPHFGLKRLWNSLNRIFIFNK